MTTALRALPAVHVLARHPLLAEATFRHGPGLVVEAVRLALGEARLQPPGDALQNGALVDRLAQAASRHLEEWVAPRPRPVINATGVILHTNLGRAPVSQQAAEAMRQVAVGYSDLEYDLDSGGRGSRQVQVEPLLCRLTGAEAAHVVNNNAGATLLVLSALAAGHGVLVSRGQLVEIGGGFRIPTIMAAGGAHLVEVGTTNRTRLADYEQAMTEEIALVLHVHTSNFRMIGFTESAPLARLVQLADRHGLPVLDDLGSGSLLDTRPFGLAKEPMVQDSVAAGAALICFSGDKLLGGPQAGIILGRKAWVDRLRRHPFTRALRPGKDVLAGLHATLLHYQSGEATRHVPVWRMISTPESDLRLRAQDWQARLGALGVAATLRVGQSTIGGGSLPGEVLPTVNVALATPAPDRLVALLRTGAPPIVARVEDGEVKLDPRTVAMEEDDDLVAGVASAVLQCGEGT